MLVKSQAIGKKIGLVSISGYGVMVRWEEYAIETIVMDDES
jgi:hypothetical protein